MTDEIDNRHDHRTGNQIGERFAGAKLHKIFVIHSVTSTGETTSVVSAWARTQRAIVSTE